ncbi:MAG: ABC transporter permease [Halanaeroarchaeum sp.]
MRRRLRIARRTVASLRSEKTILLAVAIQLFVAAFSSFMVVGLVALTDPGAAQGDYTVDVGVAGPAAEDLAAVVERGDARDATIYGSREDAISAFASGRVDAVLVATRTDAGRTIVEAIAPEGDFRSTLVVVQLKQALSEYERSRRLAMRDRLRTDPVEMPTLPPGSPYVGFTYTVLIPMLVFLPAFISGSVAADSIAEELERGTFELLRVAPVSASAIVDGKALAMVAIAPAQAALWLALLGANGTQIARPAAILVLVTGLATVLVAVGAGLALVFRSRTEAQLLYSVVALGLLGASMALPESPANTIAKLAVGNATVITELTVLGLSTLAVLGYGGVRVAIEGLALSE